VAKNVIDIALIGIGPMAVQHTKAIAAVDGMRISSCATRSLARAEAFAAEHGIGRARTLEDVLAKPEADALWLCVSADAMADVACRYAETGLPLFLEKPIGLDLKETEAVRDRISAPHMVGLNRRFYEILRRGQELIEAAGGLRAIEVHMPEDVARVPDKHGARTRRNWQFANSVHLVDLFRMFAGEPAEVLSMNDVRGDADRSYNALIRFEGGAHGIYNAQWFAPGGWRTAIYADDLSITFQPIEVGEVRRRNAMPEPLLPEGPDSRLKAGLWGQAYAFRELVETGRLPAGAADLANYTRSVALVDCLMSGS
jgi:predicted dehydrogenase